MGNSAPENIFTALRRYFTGGWPTTAPVLLDIGRGAKVENGQQEVYLKLLRGSFQACGANLSNSNSNILPF